MEEPLDHFMPPNAAILKQVAATVSPSEIDSPAIKELIELMYSLALGNQQDPRKRIMVGLAAPQIGISKRVVLVDVAADSGLGDLKVYINPVIRTMSAETATWYEGCFSTGPVCGVLPRAATVIVDFIDQDGKVRSEKHENLVVRIFQHEIDHLDGKVFVDRVTNEQDLHWVEMNERVRYRTDEAWRNWPKKCSYEKWRFIREGVEVNFQRLL